MAQTRAAVLTTQIIAHGKLPDDLELNEYVDLIEAFQTVSIITVFAGAGGRQPPGLSKIRLRLIRSQYGSDFLVVLGVVGASAGVLASFAAAFHSATKGLRVLAEAGEIDERRRASRDARLARRRTRTEAIGDAHHLRFMLSHSFPDSTGWFAFRRSRRWDRRNKDQRRNERLKDKKKLELSESAIMSKSLWSDVAAVLPAANQRTDLIEALLLLAEYGVSITIEDD